jgi:hypothetical protein
LKAPSKYMIHCPGASSLGTIDSPSGGSSMKGLVHSAVNLVRALLLMTLVVSKVISNS